MKRRFLLVLFVLFVLTAYTGHAEEGFYYYNPYGGRCYHLRPDCASIKEEWQAKMEPFPPERLSEEPYSSLERCQPCFDPPMETVVPYVPYASPYDTADPDTRLDTEGCYRAGEALTPGLYCVTPGSGCDGMLEITAPSAVFRYELSDMTGCSFYLGENMSVLPAGKRRADLSGTEASFSKHGCRSGRPRTLFHFLAASLFFLSRLGPGGQAGLLYTLRHRR